MVVVLNEVTGEYEVWDIEKGIVFESISRQECEEWVEDNEEEG